MWKCWGHRERRIALRRGLQSRTHLQRPETVILELANLDGSGSGSRARGLAGFRSDRGISKRLLSTLAEGLSRSPSCLRNNGWHFGCGHSKPDNENGGFLMTTTTAVDEDRS